MLNNLYPFKPKFHELSSGHKMHYIDEGEGENVVLMVHGNPSWSFFYRNMVIGMQDDYRCIVPDHIGCGFSDKPQNYAYRLETHINNLLELVEHINPKRLHLIVHDWGGAIGMGVAEKLHEKVGKLVILNTAAFRSKRIPVRIALCRTPLLGEFFIRAFNLFARAATKMAVAQPMMRTVKAGYLHPYNSWKNRIATSRFVQDIPLIPTHPSYRTLREVEKNLYLLKDKPMMICWGGQDFCFNDYFFKKWQKFFPDAQAHYFSKAGHYILEDKGEVVLEKVRQFF